MIVRRQTIDKYVALLNSFISDQSLSPKERSYKYGVNNHIYLIAFKLGLLKRVSRGKYLATKSHYEPIDARRLALALNKHTNHPKKNKEKQLEVIPKKNNENNNTIGIKVNTRQSTVDKYLLFLNSYVTDKKLNPKKRVTTSRKAAIYSVSAAAPKLAVKIGLLNKNEFGEFVAVKEKYTEADAKELSHYVSNITREGFIKSSLKQNDSTLVKPTIDSLEKNVELPKILKKTKEKHVFNPVKLRVFSLFWGLIKFNY